MGSLRPLKFDEARGSVAAPVAMGEWRNKHRNRSRGRGRHSSGRLARVSQNRQVKPGDASVTEEVAVLDL